MGLRMLMIWDNQAKIEAKEYEFKLSLLGSGRFEPSQLFPDRFESESEDDEGVVETYEYESPAEDFDKILAQMQAHRSFTTREAPETSEGVTGGMFPMGPDDAEWI